MRNFILLIRRFWNIILFLILEVISFSLISKNHSTQGLDIVNSSNAVAGYVYQKQNDVVYYFQLKKMNDSLLLENTRLHNELARLHTADTFTDLTARIPVIVRDTTRRDSAGIKLAPTGKIKVIRYADYHYIPAKVISNSISNDRVNYITINRGAEDGIRKEMAVVTGNGIVGRVADVSPHYARIASVLSDRKVSTKLSDGTTDFFTIWNPGSPEYVVTERVPLFIKVKKGDSVFTTGYSFFPENILIGTVTRIDTVKAVSAKNLRVRLSTNFRNLQYVYVVADNMSAERKQLEADKQPKKPK